MNTNRKARTALTDRLASLERYPSGTFAGKGIVICAGGAQMFTNAFVLLSILRRTLNSALPIEVWHLGDEELTPPMKRLLEEFQVSVVNAQKTLTMRPARIEDGWQLKAYAVMWSAFAEVLLLDADQVPVRDPAVVFDWAEYRRTGALFWPDIVDILAENAVWALCGLPAERRRSFESGQLVVDKRRHWESLQVALHLNEEAETYYRLIYGDKDTFLVAWLLTGAPHFLMPHLPFVTDYGLVQRDPAGAPLFQHRTAAKWSYSDEQPIYSDLQHQSDCLAALAELRKRWGGRAFRLPSRSLGARRIEAELAGATLRLQQPGGAEEFVHLLADGEIGPGRHYDRQYWYVVEREHDFTLAIHDGTRETHLLDQAGPHRWAGKRLSPPRGEISATVGSIEAGDPSRRRGLVDDLLEAAALDCGLLKEVPDDLMAAVRLIGRIDPSAADRLREIAAEKRWSKRVRRQLQEMASAIEAEARLREPSRKKVRSAPELLGEQYVDTHSAKS